MKDSARRKARHVTIFLDVDGVLNSFPVPSKRFQREGRKKVKAWEYTLHYRPKIVKMLEQIVEKRDADIVWLSTWSDLCRTEIEPKLEFTRSYPIIEMPDESYNRFAGDHTVWWKSLAVKQWLAENPGKRVVWIDDDLAYTETREHFAQTYRDRMLLIAPKFETGLDEHHIKAIQEFSYPRPDDSQPAQADDFTVAPASGSLRGEDGQAGAGPASQAITPAGAGAVDPKAEVLATHRPTPPGQPGDIGTSAATQSERLKSGAAGPDPETSAAVKDTPRTEPSEDVRV